MKVAIDTAKQAGLNARQQKLGIGNPHLRLVLSKKSIFVDEMFFFL